MTVPRRWTSLIGLEDAAAQRTWSQYKAPAGLTSLTAKQELSPKLLEIIQWSLEREDAQVKHPPSDESRKSASIQAATDDAGTANTSNSSAEGKNATLLSATLNRLTSAFDRLTVRDGTPTSRTMKAPQSNGHPQLDIILTECTGCFDDLPDSALNRLSCTHSYCKKCLTTLVMTGINQEASYPPKCCLTEIPHPVVVKLLDAEQVEVYKAKTAEYSMPIGKRTYCPNGTCGRWIPPSRLRVIGGSLKCPACSIKICHHCGGLCHGNNRDCPRDKGLAATIALAEAQGWKRCYRCSAFVERQSGCVHMTCRCKAEFCYVCGAKWKSCRCSEMDEARRQTELARRRRGMETQTREEARELEQALAVVRIAEERDAQERRRRQQAEEAALRREQEQLARLEQERLAEEERRRLQAEALEQELRQALTLSMKLEAEALLQAMIEIIQLQHIAFDDRHGNAEQRLLSAFKAVEDEQHARRAALLPSKRSAAQMRLDVLRRQHETSRLGLWKRHQEELGKLDLKNKRELNKIPFRGAVEARLKEDLQERQNSEAIDLELKLNRVLFDAEVSSKRELSLIDRAITTKLDRARMEHEVLMQRLATEVSLERQWYQTVSERRLAMVREHNRITARELQEGLEPAGLTAERAATILPIPALRRPERPMSSLMPAIGGSAHSARSSSGSFVTAPEQQKCQSVEFESLKEPPNYSRPLSNANRLARSSQRTNSQAPALRRNITPPELEEYTPSNGPAFLARKYGESSRNQPLADVSNLRDGDMPPSPPDSPLLAPRVTSVPRRKPLPPHMNQHPLPTILTLMPVSIDRSASNLKTNRNSEELPSPLATTAATVAVSRRATGYYAAMIQPQSSDSSSGSAYTPDLSTTSCRAVVDGGDSSRDSSTCSFTPVSSYSGDGGDDPEVQGGFDAEEAAKRPSIFNLRVRFGRKEH